MWQRCVFLFVLVVLPPGVTAQPLRINPALLQHPWQAEWVSHPTASRTDFGVFHFRRTFDLAAPPPSFIVHVSADNRYRLFVNGVPVAMGPARGDLAHWPFESIDLAPWLKAGRNVLAATVWNFGPHRSMAQHSYQTAFLLQGDTAPEHIVNTDTTWKVVQNAAYTPLPVNREALGWVYIVVGPGEEVTAARYPWGWEQAGFDDTAWPAAAPVRNAVQHQGPNFGESSGWQLVPRALPMMEERTERLPRLRRSTGIEANPGFLTGTAPLVVPPHTRATLLLDQAHLTTAYPELHVSGGGGSTITLTYAEALFDAHGQKGHRDEIDGKTIRGLQDVFRPDGGTNRRFRPLWWRTWRYLQLDLETAGAPLTLHDLYGQFTAYPFEERAAFTSSDPTLAGVWTTGWRTARLCAGETYFDCPYYEQLQYAGDTRIQALISLYVAGDDRLMRQAINAFHYSRTPEGLTQSRYPSWEAQFIPPYSLFWVAMVYDHWQHRDDPAFVQSHLNGIRGVLDWFAARIDSTGMLGPVPWWNFADWSYPDRGVPPGADDGHSALLTLQFAYALGYAAELSEGFGRADEAAHYRRLAATVKAATYRLCWNEQRGLLAETPGQHAFGQHANVMAVLVDLVPAGAQATLMQRVVTVPDLTPCTYYYRFYLDRAMKKAGLGDTYLDRLGPWHDMLALGLTTFAENPEPTRSDAHAWSASPNYFLLETVCGISPASPGFRTVRIAPHLGRLEHVACRMPHPQGELQLTLRRVGTDGLEGEVTLPEGITGTLVWAGRTVPLHGGRQLLRP
jgi:hypothetical protein